MITRTYFKPSIHGWPFGNDYTLNVQLPFDQSITLNNIGFCGGMCWAAVEDFVTANAVPRTPATIPASGSVYNRLWNQQKASLSVGKLLKILEWQQSPDLSHRSNPHASLGHRTQQEWASVQRAIDGGRPVTLTLISSSNDYNPLHLANNHRVVAYAYEVNPLTSSMWVHGKRHARIRHVTMYVYDPNYPDRDDVALTFFTGCDDSWIRLRHTREDDEFHGFFLDDEGVAFQYTDTTTVDIDNCVPSGITGVNVVDCKLTFSWACRFIPYYRLRVNGVDWLLNAALQPQSSATGAPLDDQQCPVRSGTTTITISAPRAVSTIGIELLGTDAFKTEIQVDLTPGLAIRPFVRTRAMSDVPEICDAAMTGADLNIADPNPPAAAVTALDTTPFRWVDLVSPVAPSPPSGTSILGSSLAAVDMKQLGNVKSPIQMIAEELNLAAPTTRTGAVRVSQGSIVLSTASINWQPGTVVQVFGGFNAADYTNDTTVELTLTARDRFGTVVTAKAWFYGKSIIHSAFTMVSTTVNPAAIARVSSFAETLVARGLIDTAISTIVGPRTGPPVPSLNPTTLPGAVSAKITAAVKAAAVSQGTWQQIWQQQLVGMHQTASLPTAGASRANVQRAGRLVTMNQQQLESIVVAEIANTALSQLATDAAVTTAMMAAIGGAGSRVPGSPGHI